MNIDINLLPEELRPRPPVETRTLFVILLILALAGGCYLLFDAKSDAEAEMADLEESIDKVNQQINDIRQEGQALKSSVDRLDTLTRSYESFVASRIIWGVLWKGCSLLSRRVWKWVSLLSKEILS